MSGQTAIEVSLATYKAIEAQRLSFAESHDAIIRRALAERTMRRHRAASRVFEAGHRGAPRRRGRITVTLFGRQSPAINLRDAYLQCLAALTRHSPALMQRLATEGTARRRWVAPTAEALYVTAPHLADQHAHALSPEWFVDTNVSRAQIMARLSTAARLAGYKYGEDVRVDEA